VPRSVQRRAAGGAQETVRLANAPAIEVHIVDSGYRTLRPLATCRKLRGTTTTPAARGAIGREEGDLVTRWIHSDASAAALLCVACGMADAIGYVHSGVFAANMTGNTVLTGMSLATADYWTALDRASVFVAFFAGAMLGRLLLRVAANAWLPLLLEVVLLAVSALVDPKLPFAVDLVACAMGIQATAISRFGGVTVSTVVVTSTLARLGEAALDFIAGPKSAMNADKAPPATLLGTTWLSYAFGAVLAVFLLKTTNAPLLASAAIVLVVSWTYWKKSRAA